MGMPIVNKCVAVLFMFLSAMITWSEAMIIFNYYMPNRTYLSIPALINDSVNNDASIIFGTALFCYLSSCSLFALWRIHINKDYHMHPFQLTDSGSILTNAAFAMRFMFPMGYNFLLLCVNKAERDENKDRYPYLSLFHDMSVLPVIGDPVNVFLPMLVIGFCVATWFNVFGKLMKLLRISRFEFGDPKSNEEVRLWINEGNAITRKFRARLNSDADEKKRFTSFIGDRFTNKIFQIYHSESNESSPVGSNGSNIALMDRGNNVQDNIGIGRNGN